MMEIILFILAVVIASANNITVPSLVWVLITILASIRFMTIIYELKESRK